MWHLHHYAINDGKYTNNMKLKQFEANIMQTVCNSDLEKFRMVTKKCKLVHIEQNHCAPQIQISFPQIWLGCSIIWILNHSTSTNYSATTGYTLLFRGPHPAVLHLNFYIGFDNSTFMFQGKKVFECLMCWPEIEKVFSASWPQYFG